MKTKEKCLILLPIVLAGLVAYFPSLKYGFSQDDFIHLSASRANSVVDFFNFFNPFHRYPDIFFYRPLTTQLYFFTNQTLFGPNPLPYHLEALSLHLINSILFFFVLQKIWKNTKLSFIAAFLYSLSATHFLSLYYISAFQEIGRTAFIFLSILTFLHYQEIKNKLFLFLSLASFTLSLLSKETAVVLPLLLLPISILKSGADSTPKTTKGLISSIIPFGVIALIFLSVRLLGFRSIFNEGEYSITYAPSEILQNLKWYLIWSIGLPEILSSWPSLKPAAILRFGSGLPLGNLLLAIFALFMGSLIILIKARHILNKGFILLGLIFLLSLSPVLILYGHRYPQYLDLAFLGFLPILAQLFSSSLKINRSIVITSITLFAALQLVSLRMSEQTHWTTHRAKVADYYHQEMEKYTPLTAGTTVVFLGTSETIRELAVTMAQKYAPSVWYPDKIKSVEYKTVAPQDKQENLIILPISLY